MYINIFALKFSKMENFINASVTVRWFSPIWVEIFKRYCINIIFYFFKNLCFEIFIYIKINLQFKTIIKIFKDHIKTIFNLKDIYNFNPILLFHILLIILLIILFINEEIILWKKIQGLFFKNLHPIAILIIVF